VSDSIWLAEPYTPRTPLRGPVEAQVAILGGGLTGVQLAYRLAREGVSCVLLERDAVGSGATGRNAGFVLTGDHYHYPVSKHVFGPARAKTIWTLTAQNREMLERLVEEERLDCGFRRGGSLRAAATSSEASLLRRAFDELRADGFEVEWTELENFHGALRFPGDGEIHPVRFARGLAAAAERRGVRIFEGSPAIATRPDGAEVVVRTEWGEVRAAALAACTNAYTPAIVPFFADAIFPVRGQMLATEPVADRVVPCPVYFNFGSEYARQLGTGEMLLGGGRRLEGRFFTTTEESPTVKVQHFLDETLVERFPRARGVRVARRWAGLMGFSCDELPNVGFLPGTASTFVCAAYTGHGLGLSTVLTAMAADLILRGKSELPYSLFDPRRHV
jgi:glycine/D-amino acid oxidase-like deaminating enzyme